MILIQSLKNMHPDFLKFIKIILEKKTTMGELVFNGWLGIKDKKLKNFEKAGKEHAELLIQKIEKGE